MSSESLYISCKSCGKSYLKKLKVCPHCGKKNQNTKGLIWGGIIILVCFLVINNQGKIKQSQQASSQNAVSNVQALPADQNSFISTVSESLKDYRNAKNELQQSLVRNQRKKSLAQSVNSLQVNSWVGTISSLETNTEGKAFVMIRIAPQIYVGTWNNSFSDFATNSMIDQESSVYQSLLPLSVGQQVKFSGHFYQGEIDYVEEMSLTIDGSMNKPKFLFNFTEIHPI